MCGFEVSIQEVGAYLCQHYLHLQVFLVNVFVLAILASFLSEFSRQALFIFFLRFYGDHLACWHDACCGVLGRDVFRDKVEIVSLKGICVKIFTDRGVKPTRFFH